MIDWRDDIGSEIFNAPEIWDKQISLHDAELKIKMRNSGRHNIVRGP